MSLSQLLKSIESNSWYAGMRNPELNKFFLDNIASMTLQYRMQPDHRH
jgi:hypothetical protein